jgi:hypothetical protein
LATGRIGIFVFRGFGDAEVAVALRYLESPGHERVVIGSRARAARTGSTGSLVVDETRITVRSRIGLKALGQTLDEHLEDGSA